MIWKVARWSEIVWMIWKVPWRSGRSERCPDDLKSVGMIWNCLDDISYMKIDDTDTLKGVLMIWKVSGWSDKCPYDLKSAQMIWKCPDDVKGVLMNQKVSGWFEKCTDDLKFSGWYESALTIQLIWNVSGWSERSLDDIKSVRMIW